MKYTDTAHGRPFAKDPAVVFFQNAYFLYYSLTPFGDGRARDGLSMGIARSSDMEAWSKVGEIGPEQPCERNGLGAPGAVVLNGQIHLFYQTYGNGPKDAICHAISDDGMHFVRNPSNPIFSPHGDWNNGRAIDADVLPVGDRLFLYFATRDPSGTIQKLGVASAGLDSGFGRSEWTQACTDSILEPELDWEQQCIEAPATCRVGERFFMFYGGAYNCSPQQIGCAVSDDGLHWQRLDQHPFLSNGQPGTWNASESGHPFIFFDDDGRSFLFYQGSPDGGHSWFLSKLQLDWKGGRPHVPEHPGS
ncbi:MAG TPA: hypothetical protein VFT66_15860 [Roseiflexaceae bacterium]|jgi:predicted GH43/DUF377 family glycosyl hydrolase|nr:hypothetical protein [Roseiflexaceae bacterium]